MTVREAARHFLVNRKTILDICNDPALSAVWGCVMVKGEWEINTPPQSKKWYKPKRVATMMEKSRMQIYRWCKCGVVNATRIKNDFRVPQEELLKLIQIRD
jgi:hypothetical protein